LGQSRGLLAQEQNGHRPKSQYDNQQGPTQLFHANSHASWRPHSRLMSEVQTVSQPGAVAGNKKGRLILTTCRFTL
jgi:hypothetical protein